MKFDFLLLFLYLMCVIAAVCSLLDGLQKLYAMPNESQSPQPLGTYIPLAPCIGGLGGIRKYCNSRHGRAKAWLVWNTAIKEIHSGR